MVGMRCVKRGISNNEERRGVDEKHFIARTEQGVTHFRKTFRERERESCFRERERERHRGTEGDPEI
jgi:hypothetical protein